MNKFIGRFPDSQSILYVYATAVFMVYGWTLYSSFWKVPSWFYYLSLGEVLSIYSYSFLINFLESLLLIFPLLLPGIFLPTRWWNDHFIPYGTTWVTSIAGSAMLRIYFLREPEKWEVFVHQQWLWWGVTVLVALVIGISVSRIAWLRRGVAQLADRLTIFLYFYLPLTAISFVVIIIRSLQ